MKKNAPSIPLPPYINIVLPVYVFSLLIGPSIYFYLTLFRADLLLTMPVFCYCLWYGLKTPKDAVFYIGIYCLFALLAIMALHTLFHRTQMQLLDFVYNINLITLYIFAFYITSDRKVTLLFLKSITIFIIVTTLVVILQFSLDLRLMHISTNGAEDFPAAFFSNSNNLAAFLVVQIPLLHWLCKELKKPHWFVLNLSLVTFMILAMMSRTALAMLTIYPILYSFIFSRKVTMLLIPTLMLAMLGYYMNSPHFEQLLLTLQESEKDFIARSAERLWLAMFDINNDNSVGYRSEIYNYAFTKLFSIPIGYGTRAYGEFFSGYVSGLAYRNPHSFIIELPLAYSSAALIAFLGLIVHMGILCLKVWNNSGRFWFIACLYFFAGGFIPSTILRMQLMWFPIFILFFAAHVNNKNNKENIPCTV